MTKILKLIMVSIILLPCILMAQESGLISDENKKNITNIKENIDLIKKRNDQLGEIVKENFDANSSTNSVKEKESANSNIANSESLSDDSKNLEQTTSLVDKIQEGLGSVLLGNGKISSLMFDEKENEDINNAIESFKTGQLYSPDGTEKNNEEIDPNRKSYAFLASIMYIDKNYWAVWINNKKITSENNNKNEELYVSSINKDKANIVWTISLTKWKVILGINSDEVSVNSNNQVVTKFELKPNQSYLLASSSVIEGNPENTLGKKMAFSSLLK